MSRPRTGTFEIATIAGRTVYRGRLRLADGTKSDRFDLPVDMNEKQARAYLAGLQAEEDTSHAVFKAKQDREWATTAARAAREGETVFEYAKRWLVARDGRVASVRDNRGHLQEHVLPVLGALSMPAVTSKDIEALVSALDRKVRDGKIGAKTAKNVWGTCSKLFDDATHAKPAEGLRCLEKDPTEGVRGPDDDEADKLLQFLYPSEVASFLSCEEVPLVWRVNVAVGVYLCPRDGEQRALKWSAVDLEHGVVTVAETYDRRKREDRAGTKSGAARVVPIRPELAPLLKALRDATGGVGLVCPLPAFRTMARGLRRWLKHAGVTRAALHATSTVSKQLRWHDLRATGLTWLAVEGGSPTMIRDVAGHTQTSMTDRYMRSAAILRGGRFGQPFPTLPPALLARVDQVWTGSATIEGDSRAIVAGWTGLEHIRGLTSLGAGALATVATATTLRRTATRRPDQRGRQRRERHPEAVAQGLCLAHVDEGHVDRRVPKPLLDLERVDALDGGPGRARRTKIMERDRLAGVRCLSDLGVLVRLVEFVTLDAGVAQPPAQPARHRPLARHREHATVAARLGVHGHEQRQQVRMDGDAARVLGLRRTDALVTSVPRAMHVDGAMLEIYVRPIEGAKLAVAHVRVDRDRHDATPQQGHRQALREAQELGRVEVLLGLVCAALRRLHASRRVVLANTERALLRVDHRVAHARDERPDVARGPPVERAANDLRVERVADVLHVVSSEGCDVERAEDG